MDSLCAPFIDLAPPEKDKPAECQNSMFPEGFIDENMSS